MEILEFAYYNEAKIIILLIFLYDIVLHTHNTVVLFLDDSAHPNIVQTPYIFITINGNRLGVCTQT
jgi:hypothetical protein